MKLCWEVVAHIILILGGKYREKLGNGVTTLGVKKKRFVERFGKFLGRLQRLWRDFRGLKPKRDFLFR